MACRQAPCSPLHMQPCLSTTVFSRTARAAAAVEVAAEAAASSSFDCNKVRMAYMSSALTGHAAVTLMGRHVAVTLMGRRAAVTLMGRDVVTAISLTPRRPDGSTQTNKLTEQGTAAAPSHDPQAT